MVPGQRNRLNLVFNSTWFQREAATPLGITPVLVPLLVLCWYILHFDIPTNIPGSYVQKSQFLHNVHLFFFFLRNKKHFYKKKKHFYWSIVDL